MTFHSESGRFLTEPDTLIRPALFGSGPLKVLGGPITRERDRALLAELGRCGAQVHRRIAAAREGREGKCLFSQLFPFATTGRVTYGLSACAVVQRL